MEIFWSGFQCIWYESVGIGRNPYTLGRPNNNNSQEMVRGNLEGVRELNRHVLLTLFQEIGRGRSSRNPLESVRLWSPLVRNWPQSGVTDPSILPQTPPYNVLTLRPEGSADLGPPSEP